MKQAYSLIQLLISDHFPRLGKMVSVGSRAKRKIADVKLSRYACYLIVQNGDPAKLVIAPVFAGSVGEFRRR